MDSLDVKVLVPPGSTPNGVTIQQVGVVLHVVSDCCECAFLYEFVEGSSRWRCSKLGCGYVITTNRPPLPSTTQDMDIENILLGSPSRRALRYWISLWTGVDIANVGVGIYASRV